MGEGLEAILLWPSGAPGLPWCGTGHAAVGSLLGRLFVFSVHGHALAWQDVGEGTFVGEFAVALDEPGADALLLAGLVGEVREGAGGAGGAGADLEEFAGDMGEVLC